MSKKLDDLLKYDSKPDEHEKICEILQEIDVDGEIQDDKIKKAFILAKQVAINLFAENKESLDLLDAQDQELKEAGNKVKDLEDELRAAEKQLKKYQDPSALGATDTAQILRLEDKNEQLRNDLKELEAKNVLEKSERERLQSKVSTLEKKINTLTKENEKLEDQTREYNRKIQAYREEKFNRAGKEDELSRTKKAEQNKLINELEDENRKLVEENQELNKFLDNTKQDLQDSMLEMNRTRDEIRKLRLLQQHVDSEMEELKKENDILKSQIETLNLQIISHQNQDNAIQQTVENKVKEYNILIKDKEAEISKLRDLLIQERETRNRSQIDSDKASVSALTRALQDKDKQIELLKKQLSENAQEMDKTAAVINNLNKTLYENSKMYSNSAQYNSNKQAEQKILYLENMLRDSEARYKESEEQAVTKGRELVEALNRLREYESGNYQIQQAVEEIKGLKNQVKVRDRDIQQLTKHLNKLDVTLNDILEENDDLRAKLGMNPREKLDLDELNHLRAIRAQQIRAEVYTLQRQIENLEEERLKYKQTIRKMAKQIGSKEIVASILDDDLDYYDDLIESKAKKGKQNIEKDVDKPSDDRKDVMDPKFIKEHGLLKKESEYLRQTIHEYDNENKLLKKALRELNDEINRINFKNTTQTGKSSKPREYVMKSPALEKLLIEIETNGNIRSNMKSYAFLNQVLSDISADGISLALKSEIDYLLGINDELRTQIMNLKKETNRSNASLLKAQDEIDKLTRDVKLMNNGSTARDIFQPFNLPEGMAPSSQDIISALNEYLIDVLQELNEYKKVSSKSEKEIDDLRRKYAVARHQITLLYRDYMEESKKWKDEKEKLSASVKKRQDQILTDSIKLQEFDRLLETLEKDESQVRQVIAESSRQVCSIRINEKQLELKCKALEETNEQMLKDNKKMRVEIMEMEIAVQQRIGYLERYKDMANFRIMGLQRQLEESVHISKLETVNKEYTEVVQNYRQLLEKQDKHEELSVSFHNTEQLNKKMESEIEFLKKELETEKERSNILEETLNKMKMYSISPLGESSSHIANTNDYSQESLAKRLAALEMKELNERQKADYAQRMYDQQRNLLREIENRNIELENNFSQLTKKYLSLEKNEQSLREQLTQFVPKTVNDQDKNKIKELEKQEHLLNLKVSRLAELVEISMYQSQSLEFINNVFKTQTETAKLIDVQSITEEANDLGRLHRQLIIAQISEATAVRRLHQAQARSKKLETQLVRTEQKYDRETLDYFNNKKEYISKITYLRSSVQDLRHKYTGAIPLKQQEKFNIAKQKISELKKELNEKLLKINEEKYELEDKIAEYEARNNEIENLKNAAVIGKDGSVRFNDKFLDSFKKSENLRMNNLKMDRANKRYKDEIKFLEELNRKYEIAIIGLEEEYLRLESDYDQKLLIWERRENDLERTIEHLKKQHQMIENLAINFEEISGNMPDQSLPIANQLDQAMNIIRSHIKLLAEAKIQADLSKKRMEELELKFRKMENEINARDKAIADLRLRLPATMERDLLIKGALNPSNNPETNETPIKAAQTTIESLQNRLKQKDQTIQKYQEMIKLNREEMENLNKQHELEMINMYDKANLLNENNLKKLKQRLGTQFSDLPITSRAQLNRLQELEEVTVEQDNTISALNQKIKKLHIEIDTWKSRYEMLNEKSAQEAANMQNEQLKVIEKLNEQMQEYRDKLSLQENEINKIIQDLENQKQLNSKSPTAEMKATVEKLKQQLAKKEEQQQILNKALLDLKGDMVNIAKTNLEVNAEDRSQEKKLQGIIERTTADYQDKINSLGEELVKVKRELKQKTKSNEELQLEQEHNKSQLKIKDQKIKKLTDENQKLIEDARQFSSKIIQSLPQDNKSNDLEYLRRQIKLLEDKLKKATKMQAEKPFESSYYPKPRSKSPRKIDQDEPKQVTKSQEIIIQGVPVENLYGLRNEIEQWKTRYNYVLAENSLLKKQNSELENMISRLEQEAAISSMKSQAKNFKEDNDRIRSSRVTSVPNTPKMNDIRAENRTQLTTEFQKLKAENEFLKEKAKLSDQLEKRVEYLMAQNERLKNDDAQSVASSSSTSSIRKIGESGRSPLELEKTIAMMKKVILKLKQENESLKHMSK